MFPGNPILPLDSEKMSGFRIIPFPEPRWSMKGGSYTCQHLVTVAAKMTGKRSLFKDFPKEEKGDIIPQDLIVALRQWADSGWLKPHFPLLNGTPSRKGSQRRNKKALAFLART